MAGGGGGAWKVAYADFVTAMMAFFMVMWLVGQKEDAKEAIAHYFEDPFDDHAAHAAANGHVPGHAKPQGKKGAGKPKTVADDPHHPESRKSRILAIHGGDRAAFGTVINFHGDSIELDDVGKQQLDLTLPKFVGIPQKIEIRGHVSHQSAAKNDAWKLSYDRSLAVMAYLVQKGIEQNRIRLAQAGAHEPLTIAAVSADEMARNSRVHVFLLEEFAEDTVGTPQERSRRHNADADSLPEYDDSAAAASDAPKFIYRGGSDNPPTTKAKEKGDHGHGGHGDDHGKKDAHGKADAHAKPAKKDDHGHSAKPAKKDDHGHGSGHGAKPAAKAKAGHH